MPVLSLGFNTTPGEPSCKEQPRKARGDNYHAFHQTVPLTGFKHSPVSLPNTHKNNLSSHFSLQQLNTGRVDGVGGDDDRYVINMFFKKAYLSFAWTLKKRKA